MSPQKRAHNARKCFDHIGIPRGSFRATDKEKQPDRTIPDRALSLFGIIL